MLHLSRPTPPAAAPSRLRLVAGRLALVGTGLFALTGVAMLAPLLWQPPAAPETPPPQVWLGSLVVPAPNGFAAADYRAEPQLPRQRPALTPLPERTARTAASVTGAPVTVPPVARPPVAEAPSIATLAPEAAPRPPQRGGALSIELAALAETRAPTRSPLPRARPVRAAPEPDFVPAIVALAPEGGLLRSLVPSRRPDTVTRLASLEIGTRAPATLVPEPAPALSIPAIDQALADSCGSGLVRAIPRRSGSMDGGSSVVGALTGSGGRSRDDAIAAQIAAGNLPDFLRDLVPVTFTSGEGRQRTRITLCVMPDYLAVGSDRDFVRVPLGLPAAMRLAERFDMILPTTRMVDAIHAQASVRLSPSPMEPGAQMASTQYFLRHNATVEGQRQRNGGRLGQLVAGHKKDLVLTNRLNTNPGRVAIYGWHRGNGAPIQPLSTVHGADYADYSHGIRLVSRTAYVNGRAVDLRDLLGDSRLAGLVSNEGTITHRTLLASLR